MNSQTQVVEELSIWIMVVRIKSLAVVAFQTLKNLILIETFFYSMRNARVCVSFFMIGCYNDIMNACEFTFN